MENAFKKLLFHLKHSEPNMANESFNFASEL
jgi:hypothetical protein